MSWRLAESLERLREQINAAYPNRDKTSDGAIGDAAHASRNSDHNPWVFDGKQGVVTAIDIDEDLNGKQALEDLITAIRKSRDARVKYIIYEGRITVAGSDLQRWKKYTGKNAHKQHAHISVNSDRKHYDNRSDWQIGVLPQKPQTAELRRDPQEIQPGTSSGEHKEQQAVAPQAEAPFNSGQSSVVSGQLPAGQVAEQIVNVGSEAAVPANFVPEEKTADAPAPTGFMAKLQKHFWTIVATVGGGAGIKEWFGIQISPETVELLKIVIPTILGLGFLGFLVWYVSEKVVGFKTLKLQSEINTDPSRHNLKINPQ